MRELPHDGHYLFVKVSIRLKLFRGRSLPPRDLRRIRLQRVLKTAVAKARYARDFDPNLLESGEHMLEQLPTVNLLDFFCHTERYALMPATPVREDLLYPLRQPPRTAVVGREVNESRRVRCFGSLGSKQLNEFDPYSIAAPLDAFRAYADDASPLRNAVIVFSGILRGTLTPEDGDMLWRSYRVPVFEQFLGMDGELLAWECEMHNGLHVREEAALFECRDEDRVLVSFLANPRLPLLRLDTGMRGRLEETPCSCGSAAPRLVGLRRATAREVAPAAMAAAG